MADHAAGRTPNPCIECNRHLKFDALVQRADVLGFDAVATGHHARIVRDADGMHLVARGVDVAKDQSYVLHPIVDSDLGRVLMPVGELTKDRVRARAAALGLRTIGLYSMRRPIFPARWAPIGPRAHALVHNESCPVCAAGKPCDCITRIPVAKVLALLNAP